jgi:hypothetical protein
MKETKPELLFETWLNLPDVQRNQLDAEMLEIFDTSTYALRRSFWQFLMKSGGSYAIARKKFRLW